MSAGNFIIHQKASQYEWYGDCFLSIKSFYKGTANYQIRQREYSVSDHNFLILNECTRYQLTIDQSTPIESFCVFFSPDYVSTFLSDLHSSEEKVLDSSDYSTSSKRFIERNYPHQGQISGLLNYGRTISELGATQLQKDEFYHLLLSNIYSLNECSRLESNRLPCKKKSTRDELYRRLYFAKDYIDRNFHNNLSLKEIAQIALLSENHLLRNFKLVFNISPFQYITHLKMEEARRLLKETDQTVTEISQNLGYESLGNFSFYFKKMVGVSPLSLRKKVISSK